MNKLRKNSGLYQFLESKGVLDQGKEKIDAAKKEYRRLYQSTYKKRYREKVCEHTVSFKPIEEKRISQLAREHGMKSAEYVRQSALAYAEKRYLVPRTESIVRVHQQVALMRTQIARVSEKSGFFQRDKSESIEQLLFSLENEIRSSLLNPKDIEAAIKDFMQSHPEDFRNLMKKIMSNDREVHG